jgi:hypothetical protein
MTATDNRAHCAELCRHSAADNEQRAISVSSWVRSNTGPSWPCLSQRSNAPTVDAPDRRAEFMQAFGITQNGSTFRDTKQMAQAVIKHHRRMNPVLVTDLSRKDSRTLDLGG